MRNLRKFDPTCPSALGKSAIFLLIICFSQTLPAQNSSDEREIDISRPPAHLAKSTFIEFLRKRRVTKFPGKVDDFVVLMIQAGASPIRMMVPRGRSLQAPNTDEKDPRIVVVSSTANKVPTLYPIGSEDHTAFAGTDYEGRLYAGFAERVQQGEFLSWNPNPGPRRRGKYDQLAVSGIDENGNPIVHEVTNRATCLRCHQNEGGPVFSLAPWSEAMTHDPADTKLRQPAPPFATDPAVYLKSGVLLTREATPLPLGHVNGLAGDSSSLAGVRLQQANHVMYSLCGENLHCRRYLLVAAIFNASQSTYIRKNHYLLNPAATSDLLGIDFTNTPLNVLRAFLDTTFLKPPITFNPSVLNRYPAFLHGMTYMDGFKAMAESLWPKDNFVGVTELLADPTMVVGGQTSAQEADPATPRNTTPLHRIPPELALPYVYDVAFEALGFNYQDSLQFIAIPLADRMKPLQLVNGQIPHNLRTLLENWPPTREEVLRFYGLADLSEQMIPSPNTIQRVVNTVAAAQLPLFQKYCLSCHGANPDGTAVVAGNPVIPFQNQKDLLAYNTRRNGIILSRLAPRNPQNAMPPPNESSVPHPTADEVRQMVAFFSPVPSNQTRGIVFTNYLDVRVQNVHPQTNSYIVPSGSVSIIRESKSMTCGGSTVPQTPSKVPTAMKLGLGNDSRVYLATENFPHYFQGGIVQTLMHPLVSDGGRCHVLGVSRNGQLWRIGYNAQKGFGSIPLKREGDTNILFSHIAAYGGFFLGAGRDGKLYQIVYTDRAFSKYRANVVSITGVQNTERWFKTGFKMYGQTMKAIGETIEGRRMAFSLPTDLNNNGLTLNMDAADSVSASDFAPNLLDKNSLLLNAN